MIETLTTSGILYRINRHRHHYELAIQKRKALGLTIALTLVITIGVLCWIVRPVPFGNGQGVFLEKRVLDKGEAVSELR